jgi:hypothetical protein
MLLFGFVTVAHSPAWCKHTTGSGAILLPSSAGYQQKYSLHAFLLVAPVLFVVSPDGQLKHGTSDDTPPVL